MAFLYANNEPPEAEINEKIPLTVGIFKTLYKPNQGYGYISEDNL